MQTLTQEAIAGGGFGCRPFSEEADVEIGKTDDGGNDGDQYEGLEGQDGVGKMPGALFVLGFLFLHEDAEEGRANDFFADEKETLDDAGEGDDHDGLVEGRIQELRGELDLNEAGKLQTDMGDADNEAGLDDAVGEGFIGAAAQSVAPCCALDMIRDARWLGMRTGSRATCRVTVGA